MSRFSPSFLAACRQKLLETKSDILNRMKSHQVDFANRSFGGDEADQSLSLLIEHHLFVAGERMRRQLVEVESALARLERGEFGICEETNEPIEEDRLLALPWTRLSLEGAELREGQIQTY